MDMNPLAAVYRRRPIIYKVGPSRSRFVVVAGNCKKCAYNAAVFASITGSVGATDIHQQAGGQVTRWASVRRLNLDGTYMQPYNGK